MALANLVNTLIKVNKSKKRNNSNLNESSNEEVDKSFKKPKLESNELILAKKPKKRLNLDSIEEASNEITSAKKSKIELSINETFDILTLLFEQLMIKTDETNKSKSNHSKIDKNELKSRVRKLIKNQDIKNEINLNELIILIELIFKNMESKPDPCEKLETFQSPNSLKLKLKAHQIYAMKWLKWRESHKPYSAIPADDMGLGKTLTILVYLRMIKDTYEKKQVEPIKYLKTLIVLPAALLYQWQSEIESKFEKV